jgi:serine/threonine protein phosphatase PrpC
MIVIKSEAFITDKGKSEINEDTLKCQSGKFYVVCDGVGGNGNGLLASQLLVESITNTLSHSKDLIISDALKEAEKDLDDYKRKNKSTHLMASTLALTQINNSSILIGWVGDSRVYQFRNGKIIYKSTDHTWISDAIKEGSITALEGLFHPEHNRLTRSVKGSSQPTVMEQHLLTDVNDNDYIMVCSDGIMESWIDADLGALFSEVKPAYYFIEMLHQNCKVFSNDNYTAIVYQIGKL